ncbi:hypothetical protein F5B20DRAFT_583047 [Whalleya microplaca]|nr:hypothetical protein F5B20DRAFT_583047 [Whalleya microplaca]
MSTTYILSSINQSRLPTLDVAPEGQYAGLQPPEPSIISLLFPHLTWSTLWFSLLCIFVTLNIKTMPFMWHMRILNAFRFILRTQRPAVPLGPMHIFQPLVTSSTAPLMEIDFNLHKSNSSYFADVDIARTHLVCTLFARGIEAMRGGTGSLAGLSSGKPVFGLALGAVSCSFRREIKPMQEFDMWSRVLAWDEKWVYIVTHFARKGAVEPSSWSLYPDQELPEASKGLSGSGNEGGDPQRHIFATALSKCVFKSGRKTVAPELMLELSGLFPKAGEGEKRPGESTLEGIETRRQKGLQLAQQLAAQNQQGLEAEFAGADCEALGRHTDGAGIVGVVNTLMQLAHLKRSQVL